MINSIDPEDGGPILHRMDPIRAATNFRGLESDDKDWSLYRSETLSEAVMNLTTGLGPMAAHYLLRQNQKSQKDGILLRDENKLFVNQAVCVSMAVLSGLCACIAAWIILQFRNTPNTWHREPGTMLGLMTFFHQSSHASTTVNLSEFQGGQEAIKARWTGCDYCPLVLRPWFRALLIFYGLGVVLVLSLSLRASQSSNGLATVVEKGYSSLLWKSVPTLAVLIVALYATSSDSAVRALIPLHCLCSGTSSAQGLDTSLSDMLGLSAIYYSSRFRIPAVTITQLLSILCAFLATVSSVLFNLQLVPEFTASSCQPDSWFGNRNISEDEAVKYNFERDKLRSLSFVQNTSSLIYPRHTFSDLLFPTIPVDEFSPINASSARLTVPAAKLVPTCVRLSEGADFNTSFFSDSILEIQPVGTAAAIMLMFEPQDNSTSCGAASNMNDMGQRRPWRDETHAWGAISANGLIKTLSVWRCNYTWAEIPTVLTLTKDMGGYQIDKSELPISDDSKARPWIPAFEVPQVEGGIIEEAVVLDSAYPHKPSKDYQFVFGSHFDTLVNHIGSVTWQDLADPSREEYVLQTLNDLICLMAVQLANIENRLSPDETSVSEPSRHGKLDPVDVTLVNNNRRRLVQDTEATYVLVTIISLVIAVNT